TIHLCMRLSAWKVSHHPSRSLTILSRRVSFCWHFWLTGPPFLPVRLDWHQCRRAHRSLGCLGTPKVLCLPGRGRFQSPACSPLAPAGAPVLASARHRRSPIALADDGRAGHGCRGLVAAWFCACWSVYCDL